MYTNVIKWIMNYYLQVQWRFTRMIPGLKEVPNEIRLKRLKLWSLEDRRVRADLIEVFKMFRGLSVVDIGTFFELDKSSRTRGHSGVARNL